MSWLSDRFNAWKNRPPSLAGDAEQRERLARVCALLQRSGPTGAALLQEARRAGFVIELSSSLNRMTRGTVNLAHGIIVLSAAATDAELAVVLAHECAHVRQARLGITTTYRHTPLATIQITRVMEADARAFQYQVMGEGLKSADREVWKQVILEDSLGSSGRAYWKAAQKDSGAVSDGRAMAAAFAGFYRDAGLRASYEVGNLAHLMGIKPEVVSIHRPVMSLDADFPRMVKRLTWNGQAYVKQHLPDFDPGAGDNAAVLPQTARRLKHLHFAFDPDNDKGLRDMKIPVVSDALSAGQDIELLAQLHGYIKPRMRR